MTVPTLVIFDLWGTTPAPQGSKNPWGGEANKNTKPWREAVASEAARVMVKRGYDVIDGPVHVSGLLVFPRPSSHFRANGELSPKAPTYKQSAPDLDKLQRALGDALTGVVLRDDARIVWWNIRKLYTNSDYKQPGILLSIQRL